MPRPGGGLPLGERFPSRERLRRRADFKRCYQNGSRQHGKYCILFVAANDGEVARLGMTVSRKVGGAVVRNRLRRRIRGLYRRWKHRPGLPSVDLVVHARPTAGTASFEELKRDLLNQLGRIKLTQRTQQTERRDSPPVR